MENAKQILGKKPVFGICMGHQILGQAFGGKTFKLKFGHHGGNHPIRYNPTGEQGWGDKWVRGGREIVTHGNESNQLKLWGAVSEAGRAMQGAEPQRLSCWW